MRGLRIYIAGPYSAATEKEKRRNVNAAIDAGIEVFLKGHFPYIPHLTHFVDQRAQGRGVHLKWEDYIRWDRSWVEICDALLFLGSSPGANLELCLAKDLGKEIFYSVEEVPVLERAADDKDKG